MYKITFLLLLYNLSCDNQILIWSPSLFRWSAVQTSLIRLREQLKPTSSNALHECLHSAFWCQNATFKHISGKDTSLDNTDWFVKWNVLFVFHWMHFNHTLHISHVCKCSTVSLRIIYGLPYPNLYVGSQVCWGDPQLHTDEVGISLLNSSSFSLRWPSVCMMSCSSSDWRMRDLSKGRPRPVVAETGTMCVKCIRLLGMTSSGESWLDSRKAQHHLKALSTEKICTYTASSSMQYCFFLYKNKNITLGLHFS